MLYNDCFEGKMIIVTAPSGAGKTTLVRHLMSELKNVGFSVSVTTRAQRDYEVEGKDYYFKSAEEFEQLINDKAFAEWEEVYPNRFYGTLKSEIDRIWAQGKHIIFDIDVKGATNLKELYRDTCLAIFIRPPSLETLAKRLKKRNTETDATFNKRISKAKYELSYESRFDTVLINDDLDVAKTEIEFIVKQFIKQEEEE